MSKVIVIREKETTERTVHGTPSPGGGGGAGAAAAVVGVIAVLAAGGFIFCLEYAYPDTAKVVKAFVVRWLKPVMLLMTPALIVGLLMNCAALDIEKDSRAGVAVMIQLGITAVAGVVTRVVVKGLTAWDTESAHRHHNTWKGPCPECIGIEDLYTANALVTLAAFLVGLWAVTAVIRWRGQTTDPNTPAVR